MNQLTIKTQEVLQQAQQVAILMGHQAVDTAHIMKALLQVDEHVIPFLLKKTETNGDTPSLKKNFRT